MKTIATIVVAVVLATGVCHADDSDDTLRLYLSKSDLAVLGTIVSEPVGHLFEAGVPNYICEFRVSDVCQGDSKLEGKTIRVNIKRFEMDKKDHHPLIEKDAECILFLKKEGTGTTPQWVTTDFWFGIQHPMPWMARSIKRLAKEKQGSVEHRRPPTRPSEPPA